jgi:hypothetical protein
VSFEPVLSETVANTLNHSRIPANVLAPFRKPDHPTNAGLLRDLLRCLDSPGKVKPVVRLDSMSFYSLVSLALCFSHSTYQDKLLYLFMVAEAQAH